jgi:hypothetical protein
MFKEIATFLGSGLGLISFVGYTSLASHYHALGVPLRATELTTVAAAAWEFCYQTLFLFAYMPVTLVTYVAAMVAWFWDSMRHGPWSIRAVLVAVISLVAAALYTRWFRKKWVRIAIGTLVGVWHFFHNVVPALAISSLVVAPRSSQAPFGQIWGRFGEYLGGRWNEIRQAIVGDGAMSNYQDLFDMYSLHLLFVLGLLVIWLSAGRPLPWPTAANRGYLLPVSAVLLVSLTPPLHGILLKSYRYPRVQVYLTKDAAPGVALEKRLVSPPPFLLGMTEKELFLYTPGYGMSLLTRDKVLRIVLLSDDFAFISSP